MNKTAKHDSLKRDFDLFAHISKNDYFCIMQHKTRGVVLHYTPYNDKYSIARIFTEEFGPASYLVPLPKGKKPKFPRSLFHPLAILELEVAHHNLRDIHQLKEARPHIPLPELLANPMKGAISIFLSEFLSRVLKDIQADKLLFDYLIHSLKILDLSERKYANFHLVFCIRISQFLGFFPDASNYNKGMYFDMQNGNFRSAAPVNHNHFLHPDESSAFVLLLRMNYQNMHTFRFSRQQRATVISRIMSYYRLHLPGFGEIKSVEVLQELFE